MKAILQLSSGRRLPAPRARRPRLVVEPLEDRALPSLGVASLVNVNPTGEQLQPAVGVCRPTGNFVVAWTTLSTGMDIRARVFTANGTPLTGEIVVANHTDHEYNPSVAVDGGGNFVVAWQRDFGSTGDDDIEFARFTSAGLKLGNTVTVANSVADEMYPRVAASDTGVYVVTYTRDPDGTGPRKSNVLAQRYFADGSTWGPVIKVGVKPDVNERFASVVSAPNGRFSIAYKEGNKVILKRYSALGKQLGRHTIGTAKGRDGLPDVGMDNGGHAIVVWAAGEVGHRDIRARRVSATGVVGPVVTIAAAPGQDESLPTVSVHPTESSYVVAYQTTTSPPILTWDQVEVAECVSNGYVLNRHVLGATTETPDVAVNALDNYFMVFRESFMGDGDGSAVWGAPGVLLAP